MENDFTISDEKLEELDRDISMYTSGLFDENKVPFDEALYILSGVVMKSLLVCVHLKMMNLEGYLEFITKAYAVCDKLNGEGIDKMIEEGCGKKENG